jgi:hypothetical protein
VYTCTGCGIRSAGDLLATSRFRPNPEKVILVITDGMIVRYSLIYYLIILFSYLLSYYLILLSYYLIYYLIILSIILSIILLSHYLIYYLIFLNPLGNSNTLVEKATASKSGYNLSRCCGGPGVVGMKMITNDNE